MLAQVVRLVRKDNGKPMNISLTEVLYKFARGNAVFLHEAVLATFVSETLQFPVDEFACYYLALEAVRDSAEVAGAHGAGEWLNWGSAEGVFWRVQEVFERL